MTPLTSPSAKIAIFALAPVGAVVASYACQNPCGLYSHGYPTSGTTHSDGGLVAVVLVAPVLIVAALLSPRTAPTVDPSAAGTCAAWVFANTSWPRWM